MLRLRFVTLLDVRLRLGVSRFCGMLGLGQVGHEQHLREG